ncbi:toll/interleukin-1 receptor domain-containing protein [Pseudomonas protegens]|uniref:toll/interleukin-1 receptor domain-containing protein n=1 Tax=Pseudomonas protegens TaxID=380021 RepID=UPI0011AF7FED|nr:toll/interleukin-1 receptor domain-containing protein [Pseudomonas protegens]
MSADLFISYAWTSTAHREWVRLLASQFHLMGYDVKLDENVNYGSNLHGFMQQVTEAAHVLLVVDENYVDRADNMPESGVGIETKWMSGVFKDKPESWLSILYIQNSKLLRPKWFGDHNPKGFDFNCNIEKEQFPGSLQLEELWRWIEGLSPNKANATPLSVLRNRCARLEHIDAGRDPANYVNPAISGQVIFAYNDHPYYTIGYGECEFKVSFSARSLDSVYVYTDGDLKALGLIVESDFDPLTVASFLTLGRAVEPVVGQKVVLLNPNGLMCVIKINRVDREINEKKYVPGRVGFSYEILVNE